MRISEISVCVLDKYNVDFKKLKALYTHTQTSCTLFSVCVLNLTWLTCMAI